MDIKDEMLKALSKRREDEFNLGEENLVIDGIDLGKMRSMIGYRGIDLAKDVAVNKKLIEGTICYEYQTVTNPKHTLFYIHGGGFYGGKAIVMEYICKYMAKYGEIRVCNIEYDLAPSKKFPDTAKSIYKVVESYAKNYTDNSFSIAGDSAGAHIAMNVCQLDTNKHISNLFMYYPVISLSPKKDWSIKKYGLEEPCINAKNQIIFLRGIMKYIEKFYVPEGTNKETSMYDFNLISEDEIKNLPKIMIARAEFDYFNLEIKEFIKKHNIESYEYKGLAHGFMELLGYLEEVEDVLKKTIDSIKR